MSCFLGVGCCGFSSCIFVWIVVIAVVMVALVGFYGRLVY